MALLFSDFITEDLTKEIQEVQKTFSINNVTRLTLPDKEEGTLGYVDLVLEGGGVRGIASVGALYALEELGLRFRKIAGTSVGAIVASFLAADGYSSKERRALDLLNTLMMLDFKTFVDGGKDARKFLKVYTENRPKTCWEKIRDAVQKLAAAVDNYAEVRHEFGINKGANAHSFIKSQLSALGECTDLAVCHLQRKFAVEPVPEHDFQVIAVDLTNRRKVVFPRDLHLYFKKPEVVLVGDLVRCSMSIPLFFEPFKLKDFACASYNLKADENTMFVDGGLISNFPLDIFDAGVNGNAGAFDSPVCPTFGIALSAIDNAAPINSIADYLKAIFQTWLTAGDKAYLLENAHARSRIIEVASDVNVISFNLSEKEKVTLFQAGARAALQKIAKFDFNEYVKTYRRRK